MLLEIREGQAGEHQGGNPVVHNWLMLDLPFANALRRVLIRRGVDVGDVLLMAWEKVSTTTFTGTLALGNGAIVDLGCEVDEDRPRISWWQERDGADPGAAEFAAVAMVARLRDRDP